MKNSLILMALIFQGLCFFGANAAVVFLSEAEPETTIIPTSNIGFNYSGFPRSNYQYDGSGIECFKTGLPIDEKTSLFNDVYRVMGEESEELQNKVCDQLSIESLTSGQNVLKGEAICDCLAKKVNEGKAQKIASSDLDEISAEYERNVAKQTLSEVVLNIVPSLELMAQALKNDDIFENAQEAKAQREEFLNSCVLLDEETLKQCSSEENLLKVYKDSLRSFNENIGKIADEKSLESALGAIRTYIGAVDKSASNPYSLEQPFTTGCDISRRDAQEQCMRSVGAISHSFSSREDLIASIIEKRQNPQRVRLSDKEKFQEMLDTFNSYPLVRENYVSYLSDLEGKDLNANLHFDFHKFFRDFSKPFQAESRPGNGQRSFDPVAFRERLNESLKEKERRGWQKAMTQCRARKKTLVSACQSNKIKSGQFLGDLYGNISEDENLRAKAKIQGNLVDNLTDNKVASLALSCLEYESEKAQGEQKYQQVFLKDDSALASYQALEREGKSDQEQVSIQSDLEQIAENSGVDAQGLDEAGDVEELKLSEEEASGIAQTDLSEELENIDEKSREGWERARQSGYSDLSESQRSNSFIASQLDSEKDGNFFDNFIAQNNDSPFLQNAEIFNDGNSSILSATESENLDIKNPQVQTAIGRDPLAYFEKNRTGIEKLSTSSPSFSSSSTALTNFSLARDSARRVKEIRATKENIESKLKSSNLSKEEVVETKKILERKTQELEREENELEDQIAKILRDREVRNLIAANKKALENNKSLKGQLRRANFRNSTANISSGPSNNSVSSQSTRTTSSASGLTLPTTSSTSIVTSSARSIQDSDNFSFDINLPTNLNTLGNRETKKISLVVENPESQEFIESLAFDSQEFIEKIKEEYSKKPLSSDETLDSVVLGFITKDGRKVFANVSVRALEHKVSMADLGKNYQHLNSSDPFRTEYERLELQLKEINLSEK